MTPGPQVPIPSFVPFPRAFLLFAMTQTAPALNSIACGDCLQLLPALAAQTVDLVVFSPPYDSIRDYGKNWSLDVSALGRELWRVVKPGGVCALVIGDGTKNFAKSLTSFRLAVDWCDNVGWKLFECCLYQRAGNPGAWWTQRFRVDHEYILIFFKGDRPKTFDKTPLMVDSKHAGKVYSGTDRLTNGGFKAITPKAVNAKKCRGTIWPYSASNAEGNKLKLKHPASFPDKLAEDLILCFSAPGNLILDPMTGSGTTCVMARKNDRAYLGIEINPDYCEIARARLALEDERQAASLF